MNRNYEMNDLVIDPASISDLMASTGVDIPEGLAAAAAAVTTDMVIASVFIKDLPLGADVSVAFDALTSANDEALRYSFMDLKFALIEDLIPSDEILKMPGMQKRWDDYIDFFLPRSNSL